MNKKILFFDTETTGIIQKWWSLDSQPRCLQFWYILWEYESDGTAIKEIVGDHFFNPGVPIPEGATKVHHITDQIVADKPKIDTFFRHFTALVRTVDIVVAHNIEYDRSVMFFELDRYFTNLEPGINEWKAMFRTKEKCTMMSTIDFVGIKNKYWNKYPKLQELHSRLFSEEFAEAHNAIADIKATQKCFWELIRRGLITI